MQATRNSIRLLISSSSSSPISAYGCGRGGLIYDAGSMAFAQPTAAASSALDKREVTNRVLGLLKSIPFVDPAKGTMQATRNAIRLLISSSSSSPISAYGSGRGDLLYGAGCRAFAHPTAAASSALDKCEVTNRVLGLLKSTPFVDPAKI